MSKKPRQLNPARHQGLAREPAERILIQAIHVDLTPALHDIIVKRFSRLLRHEERIVRIQVRLHRDQKLGTENHFTVTVQMEVPGPDLIAHAGGKDAYAALDAVAAKLGRELEQRHDRRKQRRNDLHGVEIPADLPKVAEIRAKDEADRGDLPS